LAMEVQRLARNAVLMVSTGEAAADDFSLQYRHFQVSLEAGGGLAQIVSAGAAGDLVLV